jgi:hypothetical protein
MIDSLREHLEAAYAAHPGNDLDSSPAATRLSRSTS